ncbi:MAG: flagellar biosynthetic protein FliO [Lachnospiraceae bacterium]|nr:flagellar biosynthetic protein FliO [Lachnospiraceae bacterium]
MLILTTTGQSVFQFVAVLLIFAFVLAITYFTSKYIGSYQKEKIQGNNITVIETQRITQNKYIQIVKIGDKYFALAVCKDTVTTISEISEESLNLSKQSAEKVSFKEFFNKAKEEESE